MTGLQDTGAGNETRRHGHTVGVPHSEDDGTPLANAAVSPGDAVTLDGSGEIAQAGEGDDILGVLVNYSVYGDSSYDGPRIKGDTDATVAVNGTYKARVSGGVSAGDALAAIDATNGSDADPGEFGVAGLTNSNEAGLSARAVEVYTDSSGQHWAEVAL